MHNKRNPILNQRRFVQKVFVLKISQKDIGVRTAIAFVLPGESWQMMKNSQKIDSFPKSTCTRPLRAKMIINQSISIGTKLFRYQCFTQSFIQFSFFIFI